jgi:regulator of RNase E activity RraA
MSTQGLSQADLDLLRQYDTPTICNVIEVFALQPRNVGYMDDRIQACFREMPPMVGYAATATYRGAAPARGDVYATMDKQVARFAEVPGPPVLVYQDLDVPSVAATFGEVMCTVFQAFGAVGLVTSGAARDLDQVRRMDFPAFSDGVICSHGYGHAVDLHVPVQAGGVTVHPGDLLHGDCNGVTLIPHQIASEVAQVSAEFVAAEEIVLDYVKGDSPTPEGVAAARAEYASVVEKLSARVQAKGG